MMIGMPPGRWVALEPLRCLQAAHTGQSDVQQDQVRAIDRNQREGLLGVDDGDNLIAAFGELRGEQGPAHALIFDQQNFVCHGAVCVWVSRRLSV